MPDFLLQRNNWFHYRRRVPDKWRLVLGFREWKKSLKTKDRRKAETLARALAVVHDELITELEAEGYESAARKRHKELRTEAAERTRQAEKAFYQRRRREDEIVQIDRQRHLIDEELKARVSKLGIKFDSDEDVLPFLLAASDILFGENVTPPRDPDERDDWEAEKLKLTRQIDRLSPSPNRISAVGEKWLEFTQHAPDSLRKQKANLKRFCDLVGDLPVEQIEPHHIATLRDNVMATGVARPTVQKVLDTVHALLNYAKKEKGLIRVNPAEGIKAGKDKRPSTEKGFVPFLPSELRQILELAKSTWTETTRDQDILMMLRVLIYTGARPEEIAQLRPCDVASGVITIDDSDGKPIKNKKSIRKVPIHDAIADFADYPKTGHRLVFTSFESIEGRMAGALSDRFTKLIRRQLGITDRRRVLYSIRHNFADACRNTAMPDSIRYRLMGHAEDNTNAAGYGGGHKISVLAHWLNKVDPLAELQ